MHTNTDTKTISPSNKKWFGRIDPFDGQMILFALAAVGGTLWSVWHFFVWPNTISTGGFFLWMFPDSMQRLILLWALAAAFLGLVVLLALAVNDQAGLVFIAPAMLFGMMVMVEMQTRNEDQAIKEFALMHAGALTAKAPLQIDGIAVADLPDKTTWSAALLKKFKVIDERSSVTTVAALCKPQCTELKVWRNNTVRVVDLVDAKGLYAY